MRRGSKLNQNEFSVQSSVTSDVTFIVLLMGYCSVCCAIMDYSATIMIYDFPAFVFQVLMIWIQYGLIIYLCLPNPPL